jgi:hypothetical protein
MGLEQRVTKLERAAPRATQAPEPRPEPDDDHLAEVLHVLHQAGQLEAVLGAELTATLQKQKGAER